MIGEERGQHVRQPIGVCRFALPDHENVPTAFSESPLTFSVAFGVGSQFGAPKVAVRSRSLASLAAVVRMPEAAVNENDFTQSWKDEIGRSRKMRLMQTKAVAEAMSSAPHPMLGLAVLAADARHRVAALLGRKVVHVAGSCERRGVARV
jgi:hypothetical protein